jgi:hypothetical protein
MTGAARKGFANEFWFGPVGGTLVKIAELDKIDPPNDKRGTTNVTTHDSVGGAEEFMSEGTYDPGDMSISGMFISGSAGDLALAAALGTGDPMGFKIVERGAAAALRDRSGACLVTDYGPDTYDLKNPQRFQCKFKVTGPVTRVAHV